MVHFLKNLEFTILPAHGGARARIKLFSDEMLNPVKPAKPEPLPRQTSAPALTEQDVKDLLVEGPYGSKPVFRPLGKS